MMLLMLYINITTGLFIININIYRGRYNVLEYKELNHEGRNRHINFTHGIIYHMCCVFVYLSITPISYRSWRIPNCTQSYHGLIHIGFPICINPWSYSSIGNLEFR